MCLVSAKYGAHRECGQGQSPGSKLEQGPGEGEGGGFLGRENSCSLLVGCWGQGWGLTAREHVWVCSGGADCDVDQIRSHQTFKLC